MTLTLSGSLAGLFGALGLFLAVLFAAWAAGAVSRRDDGPPPDDMDEKPSP